MNLGLYFRLLVAACLDTEWGRTTRSARALARFFERVRWMFSTAERSHVEATLSVSGWSSLAHAILQERRDALGFRSDPGRLGRKRGAIGMGVRAFLMPHYFLRRGSGAASVRTGA